MKPVNLNKFRKAKSRQERRDLGDMNAVKFGRTKLEKQREHAEIEKNKRHIDGHEIKK